MVKISFDYKILMTFNILLSMFAISYIIFYDIPNTIQIFLEQGKTARLWYFDEIILTGKDKGPGMITSIAFNLIATLIFIIATHRVRLVRKKQKMVEGNPEKKYMMKNIYYTCILLSIARMLETFYIITETDVRSILFIGLRIHIPLDNIAMVLFFSVCMDAFYSYELENRQKYMKQLIGLAWITIITGWLRIFVEMVDNNILERSSEILLISTLVIIGLTSLRIERRIYILSKKIDENKRAIHSIGLILFLFIVTTALSVVIFVTLPNLTQYVFRTIKNVGFVIIAFAYFPAFVHPAENKLQK